MAGAGEVRARRSVSLPSPTGLLPRPQPQFLLVTSLILIFTNVNQSQNFFKKFCDIT